MDVQKFLSKIIFDDGVNINEVRLMAYFLNNMRNERLCVTREELITKARISNTRISDAINGCVEKGWLIQCFVGKRGHQQRYLMLNTLKNRQLASRAERMFSKPRKKGKSSRQRIPAKLRIMVLNRDKSTCVMCGRKAPEVVLHVDHIVPVSEGGTTTLDNLQTLCADCNLGKSNDVALHVNDAS